MRVGLLLRKYFFPILILTLTVFNTNQFAQTKSRLVGSVKDADSGEPLFGVNIIIKDTYLGAATNLEGKFFIVNVPVGTYDVQVSMVGYTKKTLSNVVISADRVTTLDIEINETTIEGQEVVVTAQKDELHKEVSNTQMVVSGEQMRDASGVREINAFLKRLPGASTSESGYLTIRGGSADQTGTMINGLSYVNSAVGNAETSIPISAVEQVSLLSGGYNAEYGNFRSGLINITTKSGSKDGYHGTFSFSADNSHQRRFGDSFYDTKNSALRPYLDPGIAFTGTEDAWADNDYLRQQYPTFTGWDQQAQIWNLGKSPEEQVSPLDLYLFAAWMHMVEPDYEGLAKQGYTVSDEHKRLFSDHKMKEQGQDWNFDGGFGGPLPLIGKALGDATFYISNNSQERHYYMPLTLSSEKLYTTFATVKAYPSEGLSVTYNGLWKRQIGLSPIRPAFGDTPDAKNYGGFMPVDNIRYQADHAVGDGTQYWYDQAFYPILNQTSLMNGITLNHVLNPSTFWEFTVGYLYIANHSPNGDNRDTSAVTNFGPIYVDESPYNKWQFGRNHIVNGFDFPSNDAPPGINRRFQGKEGDLHDDTKVNQIQLKFDIASQINEHHYVKAGAEYNYIDINHKFWERWNNNNYNIYELNYHRWPSQTALYLQDQITFEGLVANVGIRMDYYYSGGGLWPSGDPFSTEAFDDRRNEVTNDSTFVDYLRDGNSYIWDIWKEYDKEHPGFLQPIKNHFTVSPRIGISFPVTADSKFYFNYGHFRSNPPYYTMFQYRYRYDKNGLYDMSNPNLEPPKTISYELGLAYNFYDSYILTLSGYYKDVTGQSGEVNYQHSSGTLDYDFLENNNYEDISGLEITLAKNDLSWLNLWVNFNYMLKKSGQTGISLAKEIPINYEQEGLYEGEEDRTLPQPRLNANITLRSPQKWGPEILGMHPLENINLTFFGEWRAGSYFTYNPLGKNHLSNNLQWPDYYMVDLKLTKAIEIGGVTTTFFLDVSNIFNIKVSLLRREYAFTNDADRENYFRSLHLPMFDSPEFDDLRAQIPGAYLPGDDKVGDLRSEDKPYINDPNYSFWLYGMPRDIWFGFKVDF